MSRRILCLSPHPDDVEIAMAGTIWLHTYKADIFTFSIGGEFDETTTQERLDEVDAFWDIDADCQWSGQKYVKDWTEGKWISHIESRYDMGAFSAIYTPPISDTHFEHAFVARVGRALIRDRAISLFEYKTISASPEWTPNYFVGLSRNVLIEKRERLAKFASQGRKSAFDSEVVDALHQHVLCARQGKPIVEQFRMIHSVA
jgi:LmbE family N-acetylglucosaminyl deacetylase